MKLLTSSTDYSETINMANNLQGEYKKSVIFHCYWNGNLTEKHLISIVSCYYFNVYKNKHKIILWLENNIPNEYNIEINKYCEIKQFSIAKAIEESSMNINFSYTKEVKQYYSDFIRSLLLYNYGGCWFDLDCLFLRNFDPIFLNFENEICLYQWEEQNYPNNAIFISLQKKSDKMKKNIEMINQLKRGWGFQQALLTYDIPLDLLILPCSWFDPDWLINPFNIGWNKCFENSDENYDLDTFFPGAFCYHWHNRWNKKIEENSILIKLFKSIKNKLNE